MSQGNSCAAIGLANTSKIPAIGAYVQDTTYPGPGADGPFVGVQAGTYWATNWLGEDYTVASGYLCACNSGAATGKNARWVSNTAQLTVPADGRVAVSAGGVATAASGTGAYDSYFASGTVIPANSFWWAIER